MFFMELVTLFFIFSFTGFLPNREYDPPKKKSPQHQEIKLALRVRDLVGKKNLANQMNFANQKKHQKLGGGFYRAYNKPWNKDPF